MEEWSGWGRGADFGKQEDYFIVENSLIMQSEKGVWHIPEAYTALRRIPLLILKREAAMQLSQLPRHSHIEYVCQLTAYPLEMQTEPKPTRQLQLVSRGPAGERLCFLSFLSKQVVLSAISKTYVKYIFADPSCRVPRSRTQGPQ